MSRFLPFLVCAGAACAATNKKPLSAYRPYAEQMVQRYAAQYHIPVNMVRAVIHVESHWNPGAVSSTGAMGMMQLMPGTARILRVEHPFWIYQNIGGGTAYLAYLHNRFHGDWRLALAAYNAGPAVVERCGLRYSSPSVFAYVSHVLADIERCKGKANAIEIHNCSGRKPRFPNPFTGPGATASCEDRNCASRHPTTRGTRAAGQSCR